MDLEINQGFLLSKHILLVIFLAERLFQRRCIFSVCTFRWNANDKNPAEYKTLSQSILEFIGEEISFMLNNNQDEPLPLSFLYFVLSIAGFCTFSSSRVLVLLSSVLSTLWCWFVHPHLMPPKFDETKTTGCRKWKQNEGSLSLSYFRCCLSFIEQRSQRETIMRMLTIFHINSSNSYSALSFCRWHNHQMYMMSLPL